MDERETTPDSAGYYEHLRTDILEAVPAAARRVLSVGCGAGRTEHELVQRGVRVLGLEASPQAAARARERGIHVFEGDAAAQETALQGERFDCLIYADVLEHLVDPESLLARHVKLLEPGGRVLISVPNFRHYSILGALFFRGRVRYVDAGILDRTHVRMTTRRMVEDWLGPLDLSVQTRRYLTFGRRDRWLSKLSLGLAGEFLGKQVLLSAQKAGTSAS